VALRIGILRTLWITALTGIVGLAVVEVVLWTRPSDYVNCVVVEDQSAFTGKYLKNTGATLHKTVSTAECRALDRQHDGSDGGERGRVRWVPCRSGPDCDEAGMF